MIAAIKRSFAAAMYDDSSSLPEAAAREGENGECSKQMTTRNNHESENESSENQTEENLQVENANSNANGHDETTMVTTTITTTKIPMSSLTDNKYGPMKNNEDSDDDEETTTTTTTTTGKERHNNNQELSSTHENGDDADGEDGFNNAMMSEEKLAALSRAKTTILRATDDDANTRRDDHDDKESIIPMENNDKHNYTEQEVQETVAQEAAYDAIEFESLLFSVRRTSARSRLLKLISCLKQLSAKMERNDEVNKILHRLSPDKQQQQQVKMSKNRSKRTLETDVSTSNTSTTTSRKRARTNDEEETSTATPFSAELRLLNESALNIISANNNDNDAKSRALSSHKPSSSPTTCIPPPLPDCINSRSQPPSLKQRSEWVQLHQRGLGLHCPDFSIDNTCPLGSSCPRHHVFKPLKPNERPMTNEFNARRKIKTANQADHLAWFSVEDLEKAYEKHRNITLTKESFADKIKPGELHIAYYTSSFKCPVDNIVYFAQPFPGDTFVNANKSAQGIWWYLNMKDAKEALVTHVIRHLQSQGIVPHSFQPDLSNEEDILTAKRLASAKAVAVLTNSAYNNSPSAPPSSSPVVIVKKNILPSNLPDLKPWNWAEVNYEHRCDQFNQPEGCPRGLGCRCAHVHFPKTITTDRFPTKEALPLAYHQHFQVNIQDKLQNNRSSGLFYVKTLIDSRNQIWYTATFTCPCEKTIFYAAGGMNGRPNTQGFVFYPSVEEAKLAVTGIVLNSFLARGMNGTWGKEWSNRYS